MKSLQFKLWRLRRCLNIYELMTRFGLFIFTPWGMALVTLLALALHSWWPLVLYVLAFLALIILY